MNAIHSTKYIIATGFEHSNHSSGAKRKLGIACGLVIIFIVGEVIGGLMSGSLAIMSDAAHMFSGEFQANIHSET
jgi:cobalt-zinc-cadmium efflux system protein